MHNDVIHFLSSGKLYFWYTYGTSTIFMAMYKIDTATGEGKFNYVHGKITRVSYFQGDNPIFLAGG